MRRRLVPILLSLCTLSVACTRGPADADPSPSVSASNAAEASLLPTTADELPDSDPERFMRLLEELRGTPVLVNFWGSWCPPCHEEMPRIVRAHREFGDRVQFLGVDIEDSRPDARAFIAEYGMTFPSVFDPPDAIKTSLGHFGRPVTAFYRANGELLSSYTGPIPEDVLQRNLRAIAG
jgi:cytochrome c biogenesis protein CcmG, thiol:disulfide interchange protein DsbE